VLATWAWASGLRAVAQRAMAPSVRMQRFMVCIQRLWESCDFT
jgi:hypothetical protein